MVCQTVSPERKFYDHIWKAIPVIAIFFGKSCYKTSFLSNFCQFLNFILNKEQEYSSHFQRVSLCML
jgi:hypothetical protein